MYDPSEGKASGSFNKYHIDEILSRKSDKKYMMSIPEGRKAPEKKPLSKGTMLATLSRFPPSSSKVNAIRKRELSTGKTISQEKAVHRDARKNIVTEPDEFELSPLKHNNQFLQMNKKLANFTVGTKDLVAQRRLLQEPSAASRSQTKKEELRPQELYKPMEVVGKGTFGTVFKAINKQTGQMVAIKRVLQDKRYKNRQLQILKMLHHPNVLQIISHYYTVQDGQQFLNVVMQFYEQTLYSLNKKYLKNFSHLPPILVKVYAYQMFRALNYLSALSIAHRDIKPYNILVNPHNNKLIICDFGSAKQLIKQESNIAYICSRCYRAPQLIFGATNYTPQIDMWSIGCVIVEMVNGQPPFTGQSQNDQLVEIIKVLGTPSKQTVLEMNSSYDTKDYNFPDIKPRDWRKILKSKTDPQLIDLITKMMEYSPKKRITAYEALCHPYFQELRTESRYRQVSLKQRIPNLFDFNKDELGSHNKFSEHLLPLWCQPSRVRHSNI